MQHCGIGIKAFGEVNSVDILNTIIEHGSLAGIVVFSGMNMNIQGNCIEGIEGPAIVSSNMDSLTISNNYFESNNAGNASCHECVGPNGNKGQVSGEHDRLQASFLADGRCVAGPLVLKPVLFGATDKLPADAPGEITNFCDIVLTGALAAGTACMYVVSPTQHLLDRISPIFPPFFPVFCALSPPRRDGSNKPQPGTQAQETAAPGPRAPNSALRSTRQVQWEGSPASR